MLMAQIARNLSGEGEEDAESVCDSSDDAGQSSEVPEDHRRDEAHQEFWLQTETLDDCRVWNLRGEVPTVSQEVRHHSFLPREQGEWPFWLFSASATETNWINGLKTCIAFNAISAFYDSKCEAGEREREREASKMLLRLQAACLVWFIGAYRRLICTFTCYTAWNTINVALYDSPGRTDELRRTVHSLGALTKVRDNSVQFSQSTCEPHFWTVRIPYHCYHRHRHHRRHRHRHRRYHHHRHRRHRHRRYHHHRHRHHRRHRHRRYHHHRHRRYHHHRHRRHRHRRYHHHRHRRHHH